MPLLHAAETLVHQRPFQAGLLAGLVGLAAAWMLTPLWRRLFSGSPLPLSGLLLGAATVAGLGRSALRPDLVIGLLVVAVLTACSHWALSRSALPFWLTGVAAAPGAVIVAAAVTRPPSTVPVGVVAAGMVLLGLLVADFDGRYEASGLGPLLLAVSAAGVYVTVPDTEAPAALFGAALALAPGGWPRAITRLGVAGSYVGVAVLVAVATAGGGAIGTSVGGAVACLGLLVVEPVASLLSRRRRSPDGPAWSSGWSIVAMVGAQLVVVGVASRIAGQTARPAVALAVVVADALLASACLLRVVPFLPFATDGAATRSGPGQ